MKKLFVICMALSLSEIHGMQDARNASILYRGMQSSTDQAKVFIPQKFKDGQTLEKLILILDVDGVIREGAQSGLRPSVIEALKALLRNKNVDITFISGSPIASSASTEDWRRGNLALNTTFGSLFDQELSEKQVTIFGVLGAHQMRSDGSLEVVDEYSPEMSCELGKLLIHSFLNQVLTDGNEQQKVVGIRLQQSLNALQPKDGNPNLTSSEFWPIISQIREHLDPEFRLVSNGAQVEFHSSNPPWGIATSKSWLAEEMNQPQHRVATLEALQKKLAHGIGNRNDRSHNFLAVCKTNKGLTTERHIATKLEKLPKALVVTVGDTPIDFPMHENADLAFHVGLEKALGDSSLDNCVMVRGENGEDRQHVAGTLKALSSLQNALGKSFFDLKYIPRRDFSGHWDFAALRNIAQKSTE